VNLRIVTSNLLNLINYGDFEDKFEFKDSKFTCIGQCEINVYDCIFIMIVGDTLLSTS
jgi:hypothetical protein